MADLREAEVGIAAVRAAARLCEAVRASMVSGGGTTAMDKRDGSPVTVADFGAQALVCRRLRDAFPSDPVVAEEDSGALRAPDAAGALELVTAFVRSEEGASADAEAVCTWIDHGAGAPGERFWVLDPIDGTKGFLRNDQYAVALALIEGGLVRWGFLACPLLPYDGGRGVMFVAGRGSGTRVTPLDADDLHPVTVSRTAAPASARFVESVESAHTNRGLSDELREELHVAAEPLRMDSQAKYGAVAWGQAEVYLRSPNARTPEYRENLWDHAAGALVIEEAGGKITDVYGHPLDWQQGRRLERNVGVVATNGVLHDAVIQALAPLLPAKPGVIKPE